MCFRDFFYYYLLISGGSSTLLSFYRGGSFISFLEPARSNLDYSSTCRCFFEVNLGLSIAFLSSASSNWITLLELLFSTFLPSSPSSTSRMFFSDLILRMLLILKELS